jgi:hypothetical protein
LIILRLLVVRDNVTRWNSTYIFIHRALKLESHIKIFAKQHLSEFKDDELTEEDWDILKATAKILYPFWNVTKRLEGYAKKGERGVMWEAFSAIEVLIEHLDKMKQIYRQNTHPELALSINLAWSKLDDYYKKLDDSPAYAAAFLLHSRYRLRHFENKWKGQLKKYLGVIKKAARALYDEDYAPKEEMEQQEQQIDKEEEDEDYLRTYLDGATSDKIEDQFNYFTTADPTPIPQNQLYNWWSE